MVADRGKGYGITLAIGEHADNRPADILVAKVLPDSPAYRYEVFFNDFFHMYFSDFRSGCIQAGDRVLSVNNQPHLNLQDINSLMETASDPATGLAKIVLQIEFDVADTIVPSSGIFTVKLAKRGPGLGITITGNVQNA